MPKHDSNHEYRDGYSIFRVTPDAIYRAGVGMWLCHRGECSRPWKRIDGWSVDLAKARRVRDGR